MSRHGKRRIDSACITQTHCKITCYGVTTGHYGTSWNVNDKVLPQLRFIGEQRGFYSRCARRYGAERIHLRSDEEIDDLARMWNPVSDRGWIQYYGRVYKSARDPVATPFQSLSGKMGHAEIQEVSRAPSTRSNIGWVALPVVSPGCSPTGMNLECVRQLDDGSRMSGDVHVRFCERLGVRFLRATHRNGDVRSRRAGERVMQALRHRFGKLRLHRHRGKERGGASSWDLQFRWAYS